MNERFLVALAFAALTLCVLLACGIGWTYAVPHQPLDRWSFGVLR